LDPAELPGNENVFWMIVGKGRTSHLIDRGRIHSRF